MREVQRLARIDIAETRDDALIEKRDFERDPLAGQGGRQRPGVE